MKYGLIGEKLGHSFSKEIHEAFKDYNYEIREVPKSELGDFMKKHDFTAINVTIPYKQDVMPYLDEISERAVQIGAVNTVVNKSGKLFGYNTDFEGMKQLLIKNGVSLNNKRVLVLGAGGTSKTAYAVAKHMGAKEIFIVSRTGGDGKITYDEAYNRFFDAQIIINTTPCGMFPNSETSAVELSKFTSLEAVVDAVYNPLRTKLVTDAQKRGINATGGLYMLVAQAAEAVEKFTGDTVDTETADRVYRELYFSKENIVLTGMPACGKTAIGKAVAQKLGREFFDVDEEIEKNAGKSIPEIFKTEGESRFRDYEAEAIKELSSKVGAVISTGGGAVLRSENVNRLKRNGRIYFIDRDFNFLTATSDRPLSSTPEAMRQRYNERYEIYKSTADEIIIPIDGIEENAEMIIRKGVENESNY